MLHGHPLLEIGLKGHYAEAVKAFEALPNPAPEDDRWAGYCLAVLGKFNAARELVLRARRRGCAAAGIELALVERTLGELERSETALAGILFEDLAPFDRTLFWRETGMVRLARGDLRATMEALERAWACASNDESCAPLLPGLAQAHALAYGQSGRDVRAEAWIELALGQASLAKRGSLLSTRGLTRVHLGRYGEAEADLTEARGLLEGAPRDGLILDYHESLLARAKGEFQRSLELLCLTARRAHAMDEPETEVYAELNLCAIETLLEHPDAAHAHLARAVHLAKSEKMQAMARLREAALLARAAPEQAIARLEDTARAFHDLHLEREAGWARLHQAEACLRANLIHEADQALAQAVLIRHALGASVFSLELRGLVAVLEHLAAHPEHPARIVLEDWHACGPSAPLQVRLRVFGRSALEVDGTPIKLGLARSLEVLAYLVDRPAVGLMRLIRDLFPDAPKNQARLYFHQVRYDLEKAVPGLSIPHDPRTKSYRLVSLGPSFSADVMDFKAALIEKGEDGLERALALFGGPFLPEAESEWASVERANLAWSALKVGLEVIEGWFVEGQYEKCLRLAGRLLEIDPFDETLGEYLVRATRELRGSALAAHTVERLRRRFEEEIGEVSPVLEQLKREIVELN